MKHDKRIRVLVVDDHQVVRMGLKTMLESEPDMQVVGMAASAREALELLQQIEADVLLADLHMGEMSGANLIKAARTSHPNLRAAVLTNYHSDEDVFLAIQAGATAYLLKSAPLEQVVTALREINEGRSVIPSYIAGQLAQRITNGAPSTREFEILRLVAQGMNNREIADKLSISKNTVRNHVISILEKLGTRDRTQATAVAIKRGLVRLDED
jgi:DNA-binding NarL/FixJ family response regulator